MGHFIGQLKMEWVEDRKKWKLLVPLSYARDDGTHVTAPAGMLTDLDSTPRIPFIYWLVKGRALKAAVIHDALYWYGRVSEDGFFITRPFADETMLEAMKVEGVNWAWRHIVYSGIRIGGRVTWNNYRNERDEPEDVT